MLDLRTKVVIKNTFISALLKAGLVICSLYMVPITIGYLNNENYGIWMAMSSIFYWIAFFDMGLGNGMRNYMSEAIAQNNKFKAKSYFSTSLLLLSVIACIMGVVSIPLLVFVDFNKLFNVTSISNSILGITVSIAIGLSLIQFVVKNIGMAYIALQKYAVNDLITFLGGFLSLIAIFVMTKTIEPDLRIVIATVVGIPPLCFILSSIHLFKKYPYLIPDKTCIDLYSAKNVVIKGLGFFFIQITSCLIIFGSSNIIISHYCGPSEVTVYNVSYKLFNLLIVAFTILISPLWNAYTDAYVKEDLDWIRRTFMKSIFIWFLISLLGLVMLFVSPLFFDLWVGNDVIIPFEVSVCIYIYVCLFNLNNCVTYLLNGLNKIKVQIITSVVGSIVFLLLVWYIKGDYGIYGISISMSIVYLFMSLIHFCQCKMLISNKAYGIWNK